MPKRKERGFVSYGSASAKKRYKRTFGFVRRKARRSRTLRAKNLAYSGFLGIERKFYDTALVGGLIKAPADCTNGMQDPSATSMISTPAQGDGEQNRDGKQICMQYVEISFAVSFAGRETAADVPTIPSIYVAVVLDRQSNAAQMTSQDCFKNLGAAAGTAANPLRNLLSSRRYKILRKKMFTFSALPISHFVADSFAHANERRTWTWFIPLNMLKVNFNAGITASIANVVDNSIHVVAYCSSEDCVPTISYNARLRFIG